MKIAFSIEQARWAEQVRTMLAQLPVEARTFVTDQMRLLMEKIIDFTPPHTRQEGVVRTQADISKCVKAFNVTAFRDKRLGQIFAEQNITAFNAAAANFKGALKGAQAAPFSEELHASRRDRRGRVISGNRGRLFVLGRPDVAALKAYVKRKTDNVGMACAGWLTALNLVGGSMPKWIARHGQEFGAVEDGRSDPKSPYITAINRTPWAGQHDEGSRIVRNALTSRVNAMQTNLRKVLDGLRKAGRLAA